MNILQYYFFAVGPSQHLPGHPLYSTSQYPWVQVKNVFFGAVDLYEVPSKTLLKMDTNFLLDVMSRCDIW